MDILCTFNEQGYRAPGIGETDFVALRRRFVGPPDQAIDELATISPSDGVPDHVHSISIMCMEQNRSANHSYEALKTLLDNTNRKLTEISMDSFDGVPLSPEYLGFFVSMCNKAKRLRFDTHGLSHAAEMDCLATCLTQKDCGIKELRLSLHNFDTSLFQHLWQLFQYLVASSSLENLSLGGIDLTEEGLGDQLIAALTATKGISLKSLEIRADWGHDTLFERVFCAIVDQTEVEDLRLLSRNQARMVDEQEGGNFHETRRRFFDKLSRAQHIKNLEVCREILPRADDSYILALEDAVSRNRCLERLFLRHYTGDIREDEWNKRYNERIYIPLCANRAARGLDHSTLSGLWPHLLERSGKILYYSAETKESGSLLGDRWKRSPTSSRPRTDVVYKLLRERVLLG